MAAGVDMRPSGRKIWMPSGQQRAERAAQVMENNIGIGLAIGIAVGAGLGVALGNISVGVGIGVALGLVFGIILNKRNQNSK